MRHELRPVQAGQLPPVVLRPCNSHPAPLETCMFCRSLVEMVRVAGHIQCPLCLQVAETCCEGVTMSQAVETGAKI